MSKNINTFAAGLLALTSIAAASVGCQPQASEQTAANPTEFVEQTETVDATETEAASTFEPTEEPTDEPTAEPIDESTWPAWVTAHIPENVDIQLVEDRPDTYAVCISKEGDKASIDVWKRKKRIKSVEIPQEIAENMQEIILAEVETNEAVIFFLNEDGEKKVLISKNENTVVFSVIDFVTEYGIYQIQITTKKVIFYSIDWNYYVECSSREVVHYDANSFCWITANDEIAEEIMYEKGAKIKI